MSRRPTIRDVAAAAGVSTATVSYVLNGTGSISKATSARVLACVEELGYRANSLAVAHRTGRSGAIGLAVPDLSNPFFTEFAQGVHGAASDEGYSVLLLDANNSADAELAGVKRFSDRVPEGLIWVPVVHSMTTGQDLTCPAVIYGAELAGFDSLDADVRRGGALQAEAALASGHSKVGILSGPAWAETARQRREGFIERIGSEAEIVWDFAMDYGTPPSAEIERQILDGDEVTCAVTANDIQAIELMRLYRSAGLVVPDDVSVIGFDDVDLAAMIGPQLTTVHLGARAVGHAAFLMLKERIAEPDRPMQRQIMDVSLVKRESLRAL